MTNPYINEYKMSGVYTLFFLSAEFDFIHAPNGRLALHITHLKDVVYKYSAVLYDIHAVPCCQITMNKLVS